MFLPNLSAAAAVDTPYGNVTLPFELHQVPNASVYYIIGTSGVPGANNEGHTSNAGFVVTDEGVVVFDALGTPALGYRMIQQIREVTDKPIKKVVISHYHADHTAGLDDVRPFSQRDGQVQFYCDKSVSENLRERFAYIFATENRYAGAPNVSLNIFDSQVFELKNKLIQPIEVLHGRLKIFGFRIDKFAYITDAKTISQRERNKLKDLDILIVNALRKEPHPTHFNLDEALEFIKDLKPKKSYLTHISNRLGFHKEVSKELPANVYLAYDGLVLET